ncbi:ImmA/IrrE family metallo-endopeptidase [Microbacterium sp. KSW4-4]|uniref:ImmA/IrrE family metallo-endopeptidase n=1 Tax=Microbacterium sp. KSW4-4 TaxID=2851651 RepID=UPI001FFDA422|nr:ImmA/IrrE family metallo-endopeptidase [Microbacterium sp. KSW4-4]MCK2034446.1 ImmA/IrrE family metallo-endopeptidase [Microbacterium sp. KSW4-4]
MRSGTTNPSTPRGQAYDPWEHAEMLGIEVVVRRLRTAHGRWFPDYNTIVINDRLRSRDQRLVLAHEIGHGVHFHVDERPKNERQADQFAAQNLICPNELASLYEWCDDEQRIIAELGVTRNLFRAYVLSQAA